MAKALKSLVSKGDLIRSEEGRQVWYSLKIELDREAKIEIAANADISRIRYSSLSGSIAAIDEGWIYYGVPKSLVNRLRPRLRREAKKFRASIDDTILEEFDNYAKGLEKKAKGRASKGTIKKGIDGLWDILLSVACRDEDRLLGEFAFSYLNLRIPGSLEILLNKILKESRFGQAEHEKAQIRYWAKVYEVSEGEMEQEWNKEKDVWRAVDTLMQHLKPKDQEWAMTRFEDFLTLGMLLVAVVR